MSRRIGPALAALLVGSFAGAGILHSAGAARPVVRVVAAENVYGDIAGQIAGSRAQVESILSNPDQDPHLFEATPAVARAVAAAAITISNGADYDPWMATLLSAAPAPARRDLVVARLVGARPGSNPHLWYDPRTIRALAQALTASLDAADPQGRLSYDAGRERLLASLDAIDARIASIRRRFGGRSVTATEPVFGLMSASLGLVTRDGRFQLAVMNDAEPRASDVAAFEDDLRGHKVALLLYNKQASDSATQRLLAIAGRAKIPVVGVTETEPRGTDYQHWMLDELDAVDHALSEAHR